MIKELGDSGSAAAEVLMDRTGSSFATLTKKGYSMGDVLNILGESVNGDTGAFTELWSSTEAGLGALTLLGVGAEGYNQTLEQMRNSTGAAEKAFREMTDTAEFTDRKLDTAFQNLKTAIGAQLLPTIRSLKEEGTDVIQVVTDFVSEHPEIVALVGAVTTAIGMLAASVAAFTVATQVVIPVIQSFGAALTANPVGLVAVAIGTLTAAIVTYRGILGDAAKESRQLAKDMRELKEAAEESSEAYQKDAQEKQGNLRLNQALVDRLKELTAAEWADTEQKRETLTIIDRLNAELPDLGLSYDEVTNSLNMTSEALEDVIKKQNAQDGYDAALARRQELYQQQLDASEGLAQAEEHLTKAREEAEKAQADYNRTGGEYEQTLERIAKKNLKNYEKAQEDAKAVLEQTEDELNEVNTELDRYGVILADLPPANRELIDMVLEECDALDQRSVEYENAISDLNDLVTEYQRSSEECQAAVEDIKTQMNLLNEAYREAYDEAYGSISGQMSLFADMTMKVDTNIDELIKSLDSQIQYMDTYAENMQKAMELGVDKGLIEKLSDGSMESAKILAAIVEGGEGKIAELNERFGRVEEGKNTFSHAVAEMKTDFNQSMGELEGRMVTAAQNMNQHDRMFQNSAYSIEGAIQGAESKRNSLASKFADIANAAVVAFQRTVQVNSPSRRFAWLTEMTMEGAILGVENKKEKLVNEYRNLAESSYQAYEKKVTGLESMRKQAEERINVSFPYATERLSRNGSGYTEMIRSLGQIRGEIKGLSAGGQGGLFGGIQIYVYGAPGQDEDRIAERVSEKISGVIRRREAVFR